MSKLVDKAIELQMMTCLDSLLDRANHDEYLSRIGKKEALKFLEENQKYADIIKSNLQRLEAIDSANPSEALEKLEKIKNYAKSDLDSIPQSFYDLCVKKNKEIDNIVETIKQALIKSQEQEKENAKYKQLEEQLGCSIDMILNLIINSNTLDEHCHTQDVYFDYKGKLISGSFVKLEYHDEFIIEVETDEMFDSSYDINSYDLKVKDYKKTWWLKEDRSM